MRGLVVLPHVHTVWTQDERRFGRLNYGDKLGVSGTGRRVYLNADGSYKRPGQRVANPDMTRSLQRIAREGADLFYRGEMGQEIDADMRANGGLLSAADLAAYRTEHLAQLWGDYRGHRITTNHPPSGGLPILEILRILEQFDVAAMGHDTPRTLAVLAEAMKCATRDKDVFISDPRFVDVPVERLNSRAYGAEVAAAIRAGHRYDVPRLGGLGDAPNTTHVSCADPRPGRTGSIAPGKSRFASMAPTIMFEGDRPVMTLGAPGGTHITLAIAQAIVNVVDFGMTMAEAVAARASPPPATRSTCRTASRAPFAIFACVLVAVSVVSFVLLRATGDPAVAMAGEGATTADVDLVRHQYGLERPLPEQYYARASKAVRGDLGTSKFLQHPVFTIVATRLPATMKLGGIALALALVIAIPLGVAAALHRNTVLDQAALPGQPQVIVASPLLGPRLQVLQRDARSWPTTPPPARPASISACTATGGSPPDP